MFATAVDTTVAMTTVISARKDRERWVEARSRAMTELNQIDCGQLTLTSQASCPESMQPIRLLAMCVSCRSYNMSRVPARGGESSLH